MCSIRALNMQPRAMGREMSSRCHVFESSRQIGRITGLLCGSLGLWTSAWAHQSCLLAEVVTSWVLCIAAV